MNKKQILKAINSARREQEDLEAFGIAMMVFAVGAFVGLALAATN